nr:hypothetical protein CFP56_03339 [Quercus suber]
MRGPVQTRLGAREAGSSGTVAAGSRGARDQDGSVCCQEAGGRRRGGGCGGPADPLPLDRGSRMGSRGEGCRRSGGLTSTNYGRADFYVVSGRASRSRSGGLDACERRAIRLRGLAAATLKSWMGGWSHRPAILPSFWGRMGDALDRMTVRESYTVGTSGRQARSSSTSVVAVAIIINHPTSTMLIVALPSNSKVSVCIHHRCHPPPTDLAALPDPLDPRRQASNSVLHLARRSGF